MNTDLVNVVKQIIAEQGEAILTDPARLKPFIKDYAQHVPQEERRAFGRCIEAGAYAALKNARTLEERQGAKAAFLPCVQAASGLPAAQCADALDVLETALFGISHAASPPSYTPPVPPYHQQPYQGQYPPPAKTGGLWTAVLICNIFGLNCISRFITGHIFTGVLVLLLTISCVFVFPLIALAIIWIVDLVKIGTKKWQMSDGTYLVP